MRKRSIAAAAALALAAVAAAAGAAVFHSTTESALDAAKSATARFQNVAVAEQAGYAELYDAKKIACIQKAGYGGMGIHYVNGKLVGDSVVNPLKPEALVYAPRG